MTLKRTVALVGMMGAGKTSIGKRLAARLNVPFADADHEIEAAAGMTVSEVFAKYGEPYFRDGERRVIARLLGEAPHVLATGGGAYIDDVTRATMKQAAFTI
jgi:shikimate kinase